MKVQMELVQLKRKLTVAIMSRPCNPADVLDLPFLSCDHTLLNFSFWMTWSFLSCQLNQLTWFRALPTRITIRTNSQKPFQHSSRRNINIKNWLILIISILIFQHSSRRNWWRCSSGGRSFRVCKQVFTKVIITMTILLMLRVVKMMKYSSMNGESGMSHAERRAQLEAANKVFIP